MVNISVLILLECFFLFECCEIKKEKEENIKKNKSGKCVWKRYVWF